MTKVTFASHPHLLGFEQLDRLVERTAKSGNDGYPPYNIEQRGDAPTASRWRWPVSPRTTSRSRWRTTSW